MLQPHELGWIAGTIDMKGHLVRKKNQDRRTPQMVLLVETRHRAIVKRLSSYTGTDPTLQSERKINEEWLRKGCVDHCPDQHVHVQTVSMPQISRWQVTGSSIVVVLFNIMPYMTKSVKYMEFQDAIEEIASTIPLHGQGRGAIDRAIRRLSDLGWAIPNYLLRDDLEDTENTLTF